MPDFQFRLPLYIKTGIQQRKHGMYQLLGLILMGTLQSGRMDPTMCLRMLWECWCGVKQSDYSGMHQADHFLCHDVPNEEYKFCLEKPYVSPFFNPEKHTDAVKGMYSPFRLSQPPVCSYSFVNDLLDTIVNSRKEPSTPHPRHENETTTLQSYGAVKDIISVSEDPKHTGILLFSYQR